MMFYKDTEVSKKVCKYKLSFLNSCDTYFYINHCLIITVILGSFSFYALVLQFHFLCVYAFSSLRVHRLLKIRIWSQHPICLVQCVIRTGMCPRSTTLNVTDLMVILWELTTAPLVYLEPFFSRCNFTRSFLMHAFDFSSASIWYYEKTKDHWILAKPQLTCF